MSETPAEFIESMLFENPEPEEKWQHFDPPWLRKTVSRFERNGWIETKGSGRDAQHRWTPKGRLALRNHGLHEPTP